MCGRVDLACKSGEHKVNIPWDKTQCYQGRCRHPNMKCERALMPDCPRENALNSGIWPYVRALSTGEIIPVTFVTVPTQIECRGEQCAETLETKKDEWLDYVLEWYDELASTPGEFHWLMAEVDPNAQAEFEERDSMDLSHLTQAETQAETGEGSGDEESDDSDVNRERRTGPH